MDKERRLAVVPVNEPPLSLWRYHRLLQIAGLHPWGAHAISEYMKAEKQKYHPNKWYYVDKVFNIGTVTLVMAFSFILAVGFLFFFFWTLSMADAVSSLRHFDFFLISATVCGLMLKLATAMSEGEFFKTRIINPARWVEYDLDAYIGPEIPRMRVNAVSARVRALFPSVLFKVDRLEQSETCLDPVLWAVFPGNQRVALLVWDEKGNDRIPLQHKND